MTTTYKVPVTTVVSCTSCGLSWAHTPHVRMCIVCEKDTHVICQHCHKEHKSDKNHIFKTVRVDKQQTNAMDNVPKQSKLHSYVMFAE